ncbi:structural maintenance of chromosomes flexible hinge domain-containing protein GMI1 isoform X4 [Physcomitrium patens]|uniref:structural maintenance of chromosomes flexible hinge domain-containing protein GMI1 isoform X4 n=1 Tax=Physcomitrium patens TaxID=3218 RepID=UPI000D1685A1|nr:uncharacterized protein LOC112285361 isoform X3 [Physcomitrium patens]|eukprot:XP_024381875.1 uncharacterized protein LOC112285361 isoform X3 [Physcomitrella patens]
MHEEETSPTVFAGLKRKLFSSAAVGTHPQVSHALKALARRRINTNKGLDLIREAQQKHNELDIIREQQKQNEFEIIRKQQEQNESKEQGENPSPLEGLGLHDDHCADTKAVDQLVQTVICPNYTPFSALAYLMDDALEEVSKLSSEKLSLISVELDQKQGKIIIFDTSKGLDSISISGWGASSSQKLESQGRCQNLNQGLSSANYGAISAGLYLGGSITISSRTKPLEDVSTLYLSRSTWDGARSLTIGKRIGEVRSGTMEEENNSPHGSFRKVEITDLRLEVMQWNIEELRRKLKDFFFPLIQESCEYDSRGSLAKPVTFMAMGLNLATIHWGQTAIAKSLSGDRKPFVIHMHLTDGAEGRKGNATITFHYFPLIMGKESMSELRRRLYEDNPKIAIETYKLQRFSRVTVRWRGRLLLEENWKTISFLEGCKDLTLQQQQCYNRVIAFIDLDSGFLTTPSKVSLVADHCFTKSLMSCMLSQDSDESLRVKVDVSIQGQGWPLTPQLLGLEYHNWIQDCNRKYDTDEARNDQSKQIQHTCITKPHNKVELGIKYPVFQVAWSMKIQNLELNTRDPNRGPIRLKLVENNAPQPFFTLECFVLTDSQGTSGSAHIICRPIYVSKDQGSTLVDGVDPTFYLRESKAFSLDESFATKVRWCDCSSKKLMKSHGQDTRANFLVIPINSSVEAGFQLPKEILAVVRPRSCARANSKNETSCSIEQRSIVFGVMELNLEVRFINKYISDEDALTEEQVTTSKTVYNCTTKPCVRKGVQGLYSFVTNGTDLNTLFTTMGTYLLAFSVVGEKHRNVAPAVARINVSACEEVEHWQLCSHPDACFKHPNHWKLKNIVTRIGKVIESPLYLSGFDVYNNRVALSNVPEELHFKVGQLDGEFLELSVAIPRECISLSANNATLELKDIEIGGGCLAQIATTYAAQLWILIHNFPVASYILTVLPGEPASVALTECDRLDNCLRPGQMIEKFVIQAFDDFKNVVENGSEIRVGLEGLQLVDKRGSRRQVVENGCIHLGGLLKVTAEYNSRGGTITVQSDKGRSLLALNFHTVYRSLRILKEPEEAYTGSQLEGLKVQVIDEDGNVDTKMDGSLHYLTVDWNSKLSIPLVCGVCSLPPINLPLVPGSWYGRVAHAVHPELFCALEVQVVSKLPSDNHLIPATPPNQPCLLMSLPQQLQLNWNVKKEIDEKIESYPLRETSTQREEYERQLKDFIDRNTKMQRKLREQGRKVKRAEEELGILKRTKMEVDDMEALWKVELKTFESVSKAAEVQKDAKALCPSSQNNNTASQVIELLQKQGDPPGSHAASVLLEAVVNNGNVFAAGGPGSDILGIVALLACVDNDILNRALVDFLGIEKMLMIVCRSEEGLKYLEKLESQSSMVDDLTLHAFARSRNRRINGTFRALVLNEASFYKRKDGLPSVNEGHPQKLLLIPDPWPRDAPCPKGYIGYAVNLLRFNPQQLECYATSAKHSLRESLFFQLFSYLQVYDTKEHMLAAQQFHTTGAVSLDGGLIHGKTYLEHVFGEEPAVKFPVLREEKHEYQQTDSMLSSPNCPYHDKKVSTNMLELELTHRIKALHEETGYTNLCLLIKKMETKLVRARSKITVIVKEVNQEEDKKAEILRKVAELED